MSVETMLSGWTGPSSPTEQAKQERTERMVKLAIRNHAAFEGAGLAVYAKGSYPNNTNVRSDSDVDIAVECQDCIYWTEEAPGVHGSCEPYSGPWTPAKLRSEVQSALEDVFHEDELDFSGTTALRVRSSTARVDADVVPCFGHEHHFADGSVNVGTRIFRTNGERVDNYPKQHLERGRAKNNATGTRFKQAVRVFKRIENAMAKDGLIEYLPSFFVECLIYNCTDFGHYSWVDRTKGLLSEIYAATEGPEPAENRWAEVNECKYLFWAGQPWSRKDAHDFAAAGWNYLDFG